MQFIDIGANLTDPVFRGVYRGRRVHANDFDAMLERARSSGMKKIIVTVGSLKEQNAALDLAKRYPGLIYITSGVHPTRGDELSVPGAIERLDKFLEANKRAAGGPIVAFGEFGLDYDRTRFCAPDVQRIAFARQLELARKHGLPLFLHCRAAYDDFFALLEPHAAWVRRVGGVCHCFTGTAAERDRILAFGLDIGLTGCSLKTAANLDAARGVPLARLHLETDAPWCDIRPSHAGAAHLRTRPRAVRKERFDADPDTVVKGRYEPRHIVCVAEVVAGARGCEPADVARHAFENSSRVYFPSRE
eukprot:gnl/Chilomastix_cuspidata/2810.p2 GENE.gnl/Chilomastix_cuspidata/2810~~gnl/Chilomastix_cuspidata/2810.p2  ORF type:complete len:304 (-),score=134.57 gnl/Chilomastix_cuspidata/2810:291-1202(-)